MKGVSPLRQRLTRISTGRKLLISDKYKLTCPRCRSKMRKVQKQDITIDVCSFCGGMFLDDGEIDKLQKLGGKTNKAKKK